MDTISRCEFPSHYKLRITLRIGVGHSPFSFCGGELNIRVSFMLNHKVIKLTVHLINNLKRRVIENRRADASRLSGPHLMAPTLTLHSHPQKHPDSMSNEEGKQSNLRKQIDEIDAIKDNELGFYLKTEDQALNESSLGRVIRVGSGNLFL